VRRISAESWECTACGAVVAVPVDTTPLVVLVTVSGQARERVVTVDGAEVHRCRAQPD
jgi:hypothetical protein